MEACPGGVAGPMRLEMSGERVAVIGAGIAGLRSAQRLVDQGAQVVVFDKGRGVGGRTASRHRVDSPGHDHGAQYFTARGTQLAAAVSSWREQGVVERWEAPIGVAEADGTRRRAGGGPRWVGAPSMRAMAEHMAAGLDVRSSTRVTAMWLGSGGLQLEADVGPLGTFDRVVVTVPAPEAVPLVAEAAPELASRAASVRFLPTWAAMLQPEVPLPTPFAAAFTNRGPIDWWAREATKPGRPPGERVTVHLGPSASLSLLESEPKRVAIQAWEMLKAELGAKGDLLGASAHRWRFARPEKGLGEGALRCPTGRVVLAGDWTGEDGRVESAYVAGERAAEVIAR